MPDDLLQQLLQQSGPSAPVSGDPLNQILQMRNYMRNQYPLTAAVQQARQMYPWVNLIKEPIHMTTGIGPYMSESYEPHTNENPYPSGFTVELRSPQILNDPAHWPAALGREAGDYLARHDPVWESTSQQFRKTMTPQQLAMAWNRYQSDPGIQKSYTFEEFLKQAELQEFTGGYVFNMPGWVKNNAELYTPQQKQILDKLKAYLYQGRQNVPPVNIY